MMKLVGLKMIVRLVVIVVVVLLISSCEPIVPGEEQVGESNSSVEVDVLRWQAIEAHYAQLEAKQEAHLASVEADRWQALAGDFGDNG